MNYDIFISYAHQGDRTSREAVTALVARLHAELEADFRRRFNRNLEIFIDKEDIKDFDHWQVRCHRALRDSQFFIACLSRTYLCSDACRWEWEEWCRHELEHGLVGRGAASLWFVRLEDLDAPEDAALLRRWKGDLLQRFHIQCHEWRHDNSVVFLDEAARLELQQLTEHVAQRLRLLTLDRARRGNLPWPNANFIGREPELGRLRVALLDDPEPAPTGIHGIGGMGKSALAQAFAYKEADAFPGGCWLLHCEGRDRLVAVFRALVTELEVELTDEDALDDARAVRRIFDVLRARGPALFLLDNVDQPALLSQNEMRLLADQPWARVLYTTRLAPNDFSMAGAEIRPLDLDRLPENQAVELIRRYQPGQTFVSPEHEVAAREIVRELSGLTLAVETAAVYLGQCDSRATEPRYAVDLRDYLVKLREDLKAGGGEGVMSQLREVTATLRPTLARLDAPTRTVLQIASLLAPEGVVLPWVRAMAGQIHPELASEAATGQCDPWTQLIRGLMGMRLFQPTPEPHVVAMHRILQRVLESESPEGRGAMANTLIQHAESRARALKTEWIEWKNRWEVEPLRLFAELSLSNAGGHASMAANETAMRLADLGRFSDAELLLRHSIAAGSHDWGQSHPDVISQEANLAELLLEQSKYSEAEPIARRVLQAEELRLGPEHSSTLTSLNTLAMVLEGKGNYDEALPLLRRSLEIRERVFGPADIETHLALNNLASVLFQSGKYEEALQLLRRGLDLAERVLGPEHPNTLTAVNNLALLLREMGEYKQAGPLLRRGLEACERVLGPDHPHTLLALSNLATLYQQVGDFKEARPLARRALDAYQRVLGPDHPNALMTLNNLAMLLQQTGDFEEAQPLARRAFEENQRVLGPDHPNTLLALNNLATLLVQTGDFGEAQPLARRAFEENQRVLGPDHPNTLASMISLARLLQQMGLDEEAEPLARRAFDENQRVLGPNHPHTLTALSNLAGLLQNMGDYEQAEPLAHRAVDEHQRVLGPDHPATLLALNNLALLHQQLGDYERAQPLARRVFEAYQRVLGPDHPNTLTALNNLAVLQQKMGHDEQAEPLIRRALESAESRLGAEHPLTAKIRLNFRG